MADLAATCPNIEESLFERKHSRNSRMNPQKNVD